MNMDTKKSPNPSPPRAQVKKENEEEIKDFAETAMNELLGWYGYERLELRRWAASKARGASSPERNTETNRKEECSWCNKSISSEGGALQQAGAIFCSELCFSQSRRANFKRAKTCDWCRHVRHTVAYVDFQDGATQLQFCSDKCLNQYKMHIFCRETQAHLDLNPHLVNASSTSNLITPELWLKNCKSRSVSPNSDRSTSPAIENMSKKPTNTENTDLQNPTTGKSPQPLITIAPTAKLMKPKRTSEELTSIRKSPEIKKDSRNKMNLRKRRTSKCTSTVTSQTARQPPVVPKAQDLRMYSSSDESPPASSVINGAMHSPPHSIKTQVLPPPQFPEAIFGISPMFMDSNYGHISEYRHPHMFPPRFNLMPQPSIPVHQDRPRFHPPINFSQPLNQTPPVTVLVPYPVILPVPLPIPIPLPLSSFIQAQCLNKVKTELKHDDGEGPLDFTISSDKNRDKDLNEISVDVNVDEDITLQNEDDRTEEDKNSNVVNQTVNPEVTLPKFKITRVGPKMARIVAKARESSEKSRPLRKRRRLVEVVTDDEQMISKRKTVQV